MATCVHIPAFSASSKPYAPIRTASKTSQLRYRICGNNGRASRQAGRWHHHPSPRCEATDTTGSEPTPAATKTIRVTVRKPLGLVLAEKPETGVVFVEDVVPGGNADKTGQFAVGDIISRCSATVLKAGKDGEFEREGYGQRPYDNWETIMFDCKGQDFSTVMSAIGSNNERWGIFNVTLEVQRSLP